MDDEAPDDELDEDIDPDDDEEEIVDADDLDDELDDALEDDDAEIVVEDEEEDDADDVPAARTTVKAGEDEEDDDEADPDDVEADLDRILKDRLVTSDDDEEDEDEPEPVGEPGERVAAKGVDEFTCETCFLIVHPRQFGRAGRLNCPEGYDPCPSIAKVEAMLKRAKKR